jgi:hypothetical protein
MIKEDAIAGKEVVSLSVVLRQPICVNLGSGVRTLWLKRCILILRCRSAAEHLTGGCLVELGLNPCFADRLQQSHGPQSGDVTSVFRDVKTHTDMALGPKVVDFIRLDIINQVCHLP